MVRVLIYFKERINNIYQKIECGVPEIFDLNSYDCSWMEDLEEMDHKVKERGHTKNSFRNVRAKLTLDHLLQLGSGFSVCPRDSWAQSLVLIVTILR